MDKTLRDFKLEVIAEFPDANQDWRNWEIRRRWYLHEGTLHKLDQEPPGRPAGYNGNHSIHVDDVSGVVESDQPVKRKRGRPRKNA